MNLLENIERSILPIFEVYPSAIQNLNQRKIDLKTKNEVQDNLLYIKSKMSFGWYKFTPSSMTLASLDGLSMLIPAFNSLVDQIENSNDKSTKDLILKSWK